MTELLMEEWLTIALFTLEQCSELNFGILEKFPMRAPYLGRNARMPVYFSEALVESG
jgi:hypothetical protein